jgi:transposase-like protein
MASGRDSQDLAAYYDDLLEEQEDRGLSMAEFAEEVGVSAATLYSWRLRLRGQGQQAKLLEVDLVEGESRTRKQGAFTLKVSDRISLEVPSDFDEGALARLLGLLDRC